MADKDLSVMQQNSAGKWVPTLQPAGEFDLDARFIRLEEVTLPPAPSANRGVLFVRDNGSGKTQLVIRFSSGVEQIIATEP